MTPHVSRGLADRFLRLVGEDRDPLARSKADAFRRFLLLLVAAESSSSGLARCSSAC